MADNNENNDAKQEKGCTAKNEDGEEGCQCEELKEKFLRLAAEFDNYKKRTSQDIGQAKELGMAELAKSLLTVIDEFELTLMAVTESGDRNIGRGIELVYANFMDALKKAGLKEIDAKDKSDPYVHEIMMAKESDAKEGTIIEVVKKGYLFKDKMLRPVSVIVSKGKAERSDEDGTETDLQ